LVAGPARLIGNHLADKLIDDDFEVGVLGDLSTGTLENLSSHIRDGNLRLVKGDVFNSEIVTEVVKDIDAGFHKTAVASVTRLLVVGCIPLEVKS